MKLKTKLDRLRKRVEIEGPSKELRDALLAIMRKRCELITKQDLITFGIIIPKK